MMFLFAGDKIDPEVIWFAHHRLWFFCFGYALFLVAIFFQTRRSYGTVATTISLSLSTILGLALGLVWAFWGTVKYLPNTSMKWLAIKNEYRNVIDYDGTAIGLCAFVGTVVGWLLLCFLKDSWNSGASSAEGGNTSPSLRDPRTE